MSTETESGDYVWDLFEKGEGFAEEYVHKGFKELSGGDIPLIKAGSLALLAVGVKSYKEFLFGSASLAAYYYLQEASLDGAITGLAGVQFARGQYLTATFPTFMETYASFQDWRRGSFMTKKQILKLAIYVAGFYLGLKKMV